MAREKPLIPVNVFYKNMNLSHCRWLNTGFESKPRDNVSDRTGSHNTLSWTPNHNHKEIVPLITAVRLSEVETVAGLEDVYRTTATCMIQMNPPISSFQYRKREKCYLVLLIVQRQTLLQSLRVLVGTKPRIPSLFVDPLSKMQEMAEILKSHTRHQFKGIAWIDNLQTVLKVHLYHRSGWFPTWRKLIILLYTES